MASSHSTSEVVVGPKIFELELECEPFQVKDLAKAMLHTILFHRCLIQVKPINVELNFVDITYTKCDQKSIEKDIEHASTSLQILFENHPGVPQVKTFDLIFYEKREKKGWLFKTPHETVWERWRIQLKPIQPTNTQDKTLFGQRLERQLRACLMYIANESLEQSDHVPNISDLSKPFPYKIIVANGAPETLVGMLRKMVSDTSVPPILG